MNKGGLYVSVLVFLVSVFVLCIISTPISFTGGVTKTTVPAAYSAFHGLINPPGVLAYEQLNITNAQTVALPAPFQQLINLSISGLMGAINTSKNFAFQNVEFYNGSSGTVIPSWLESYSLSKGYALYWVSLPNGIPASSTANRIYVGFASNTTSLWSSTVGEAPDLSPVYGQHDNGADVFSLYINGNTNTGSGFSMEPGWTLTKSSMTGPNGNTINVLNSSDGSGAAGEVNFVYSGAFVSSSNSYIEEAESMPNLRSNSGITGLGTSSVASDYGTTDGGVSGVYSIGAWAANGGASSVTTETSGSKSTTSMSGASVSANTWYYSRLNYVAGASSSDVSLGNNMYANTSRGSNTNTIPSGSNLYIAPFAAHTSSTSLTITYFDWVRLRAYPPKGAMPTVAAGPYVVVTKPALMTSIAMNITNLQPVATPAPFQQMINLSLSGLTGKINTSKNFAFQNVEFYNKTSGAVIPSWLESYSLSKGYALYWLSLPNGIPASTTIKDIYIGFASNTSSLWSSTVGEAPGLSQVYGQHDSGINVFHAYWSFGGSSSLPFPWVLSYSSGAGTFGAQYYTIGASGRYGGITTAQNYSILNEVLDAEVQYPISTNTSFSVMAVGFGDASAPSTYFQGSGGGDIIGGNAYGAAQGYNNYGTSGEWGYFAGTTAVSPAVTYTNAPSVYSTGVSSSTTYFSLNYGEDAAQSGVPASSSLPLAVESQASGNANLYWARIRALPPNGVMPQVSIKTAVINTTFTETGLPSGTAWSVLYYGVNKSSTTNTIRFSSVPSGNFSYVVTSVPSGGCSYTPSPATGYTVSGTSLTINYSVSCKTQFRESGLPSGASWSIYYDGKNRTATGTAYSIYTSPGTFQFLIGSPTISGVTYLPSPSSGNLLAGSVLSIVFSTSNTSTLNTVFNESGLPFLPWVVFNGINESGITPTITFTSGPGNFQWTAACPSGYTCSPSSGTIAAGSYVTILYSPQSASLNTTFTESGLPSGHVWNITYDSKYHSNSTVTSIFVTGSGTFAYTTYKQVNSSGGCTTTYTPSASGNLVAGSSKTITYTGSTTCTTTFTESGLPTGSSWWLVFNGANSSVTTVSRSYTSAPGIYTFTAPSYCSPSSGTVVAGNSVTLTCSQTNTVITTFTESGLPSGTKWTVKYDSINHSSTSTSMTFNTSTGTFSFTVGAPSGYTASPSSGSLKAGSTQAISYTVISSSNAYITESGLPPNLVANGWSVDVATSSFSSTTNTITLSGYNSFPLSVQTVSYAPTVSTAPGVLNWIILDNDLSRLLTNVSGSPRLTQIVTDYFNNSNTFFDSNQNSTSFSNYAKWRFIHVLDVDNYTVAVNLLNKGIDSTYRDLLIDFENWSSTPNTQQTHAYHYMNLTGWLAANNTLGAINSPGGDLVVAFSGSKSNEYKQYISLDITGNSLATTPKKYVFQIYNIQSQSMEAQLNKYMYQTINATKQGRSVLSNVTFLAGLTTGGTTGSSVPNASATVLYNAALSVRDYVSGFWLNIPYYAVAPNAGGNGMAASFLAMLYNNSANGCSLTYVPQQPAPTIKAGQSYTVTYSLVASDNPGICLFVDGNLMTNNSVLQGTQSNFTALTGNVYNPYVKIYVNGVLKSGLAKDVNSYLSTLSPGLYKITAASNSSSIQNATFYERVNSTSTGNSTTTSFIESGLSSGANWWAKYDNLNKSSATNTITMSVSAGTYTFTVSAPTVGGCSYTPSPASGSLASGSTKQITYSGSCKTQFTETGLLAGTPWNIYYDGKNRTATGTSFSIFTGPGTFAFSIGAPTASGVIYYPNPASGNLAAGSVLPIVFSIANSSTLTTTFTESGLPSSTIWFVNYDGVNKSSTTSSIVFSASSGTYPYEVYPITLNGCVYAPSPSSGALAAGSSASITFSSACVTAFNESGLPPSSSWWVVYDGINHSSTSTSMTFSTPTGTFSFVVSSPTISSCLYSPSPSSGNLAAGSTQKISYTSSCSTTFTESGLPSGTVWNVTYNGIIESSTASTISFGIASGYKFTVALAKTASCTYSPSPSSGTAASSNSISFSGTCITTFTESGLPSNNRWGVTYHGVNHTSTTTSVTFNTSTGTFSFLASAPVISNCSYTPSPSSGNLVAGGSQNIAYTKGACITIFDESGLPSGTNWTVLYDGFNHSSTSSTITFSIFSGTYSFVIGSPAGYIPSPATGNLAAGSTQQIVYAKSSAYATTTFTESGLPSGTKWTVKYDSINHSSTSTSMTFNTSTGTFSFTVGAPSGYTASPSSGSLKAGSTQAIAYSKAGAIPIKHVITIMMENQGIDVIMGDNGFSKSTAPYEQSLTKSYSWGGDMFENDGGINFFAVCHPSATNYLAETSGGLALQCGSDSYNTYNVDNIAYELQNLGMTWKAYMESMPSNCDTSDSGGYAVRHNPFSYYTDLLSTTCGTNDVGVKSLVNDFPYSQTPAAYTWISPNLTDDAHPFGGVNRTILLKRGDKFLSEFIPKLMNTTWYKNGSTVIFLVYDEAAYGSDNSGGYNGLTGGPTYFVAISPYTQGGGVYATNSSQYNVLATAEWLLGVPYVGKYDGTSSFPPMKSLFSFG